jgi:predicted outer membrane repeat protein
MDNKAANGGAVYAAGKPNVSFTNSTLTFINNSASVNGGAVYVLQSTITFTNSIILFDENSVGDPAAANDVYLDYASLNFSGNNTLPNGIQTSGAGTVRKTQAGTLILQGDKDNPTIIINNFSIEGGVVEFQNIVSTASNLNVIRGATLALADSGVNISSLYVTGDFNLNGILTMDVNLETGEADWISVDGNFIAANAQLSPTVSGDNQKAVAKIMTINGASTLNGLSVSGDYDFLLTNNDIYIGLAWNIFVLNFQEAETSIVLNKNAKALDENSSQKIESPTENNILVDGNFKTIDSNNVTGLGFVIGLDDSNATTAQVITFKNISLTNFKNTDLINGGAVKAQSDSMVGLNGRIGFYNNQAGNKLNDIYLGGASSISFSGNVVLTNGIRTAGSGTLSITDQGEVSF